MQMKIIVESKKSLKTGWRHSKHLQKLFNNNIKNKDMSTAAAFRRGSRTSSQRDFVTKYIFSQDHKMISKQYLITGLFMGIIGIAMSLLFRLQLAWPEQPFGIFEVF